MKPRLIAMGLWVRWIILGLLHPIGMVHVTCGLARQLYRNNLTFASRPLWTVVILHLVILLTLLGVVAFLFWRFLELFLG